MDINSLLSGLLGGLGQSDAAIKAEQPRAAATTAGIETAGTNMESLVAQSIASGTQTAGMAAEIERQKAATGETAQRVAGLDPDDLNSAYVQSMAQLTDVQMQREAAMQEYRKLTETSFLDNPVGYIFNQLALPQVVQKHNNLATQQDAITGDLATRTQLMYQNKTQVTANVADATKTLRLQEAEVAATAASALLERTRMENFGKVSTSRMNELALQDKIIQNASTRYNAGMNMATFKAQQERDAATREEHVLRMEELLANKKTRADAYADFADGLAYVSGALGYKNPITPEVYDKMPASLAKKRLFAAAQTHRYGDSLDQSIEFLQGGNIQKMQEQDPAFIKGLQQIAKEVKEYATATQKANPTFKEAQAKEVGADDYQRSVALAAHDPSNLRTLNDPYWDTHFNPNRSQDATMLSLAKAGKYQELANNSYVKVLSTVADTVPPGTLDLRGEDRNNAIKALATLVSERKIPLKQAAADLVAYNRAAADYNQKTLKLASLGFEVQESAFVRVPGAAIIGDAAVGDMMNQLGAEHLLAEIAANTLKGRLTRPANPAMAIFGGAGTVGILAAQQMNRLFDITPEK